MQSIWDLLPASLWPTQRFIAPDEQARIFQAFNSLQASRDRTPPLAAAGVPSNLAVSPSLAAQQGGPPTTGDDSSNAWASTDSDVPPASLRLIAAQPGANVATPGGILGAIFGSEPATKLPPPASYGVIPKNAQPQPPELPPPISAWQLPERDFSLGSPATIERMIQTRAAGLNGVALEDPGRTRRDAARAADLLLPGSGNFVSGDWDNITASDVGSLVFNLAATIPPFRIGSTPARIAGRATRVGAEAESIAARAAASRGERAPTTVVDSVEPASSLPVGPPLTGQNHHAISKKVHRAIEEIPGLAGIYRYRDPRFQTRAIDGVAHKGYQTWHRKLDDEVEAYVRSNPMTPEEFEDYLRKRYAQPDLLTRFPNGL